MLNLKIETDVYNERRYGTPWIAKACFDVNGSVKFEFGNWIGDKGYSGTLRLKCEVGGIVARGQKDNRVDKNNVTEFFVLNESGELDCISKKDAFEHWEKVQEDKYNVNDDSEIVKLENKIAEMQQELKLLKLNNS